MYFGSHTLANISPNYLKMLTHNICSILAYLPCSRSIAFLLKSIKTHFIAFDKRPLKSGHVPLHTTVILHFLHLVNFKMNLIF